MTALSNIVMSVLPYVFLGLALWALAGALLKGWEWMVDNWGGLKPAARRARDWARTDDPSAVARRQQSSGDGAPTVGAGAGTTRPGPATGTTPAKPGPGPAPRPVAAGGAPAATATGQPGRPRRIPEPIGPQDVERSGQQVLQSGDRGERHGFVTATGARRGAAYVAGFGRGAAAGATAPIPARDAGQEPGGETPEGSTSGQEPAAPTTTQPDPQGQGTRPDPADGPPEQGTPNATDDPSLPPPPDPARGPSCRRCWLPETERAQRSSGKCDCYCHICGLLEEDCDASGCGGHDPDLDPDFDDDASGQEPDTRPTPAPPGATVIPWKKKEGPTVAYQIPGEITDLATLSGVMQSVLKELGAGEDLTNEMTALAKFAGEAATIHERFTRDMGAETTAATTVFEEASGIVAKAMLDVLAGLQSMADAADIVAKQAEATRGEHAA